MEGSSNHKLGQTLKDLGESSSLHGIPKIFASRQNAVKILWGILLCGAVVLFCLQFVQLLREFKSYPVKTSVSLKFAALPFPAVTICNMNPFKTSLLKNNSETSELEKAVYEFEATGEVTEDSLSTSLDAFFEAYENDYTYFDIDTLITGFDDTDFEFSKSFYDSWKTSMLAVFRDTPSHIRYKIGHKLETFVHLSKYTGFKLQPRSKFSTLTNTIYGNCFTIDNLPSALTSGQDNGLTLELNLEINDYLEQFSTAYGAKIVIHEKGTYPLPDRDGFILNPGFETNIGLRLVRIRRLGGVYGTCEDEYDFELGGKYYKDTVPLCHVLCESELVSNMCGCVPHETPSGVDIVSRTCTANDTVCVYTAREGLVDALERCSCPNTCNEDSFAATITGRSWPLQSYLERVLLKEVCSNSNITSFSEDCIKKKDNESLSYEDYQKISKNFLKVNIYFEDLNFEEISEQPLYNWIRFLSDIGGMMGLFLGASLLTYVELLQLILELTIYMKHKFWNAKASTKTVSVSKVQPFNA